MVAGVAHVHSRQLAHRDVKPHNVLIVRPGSSRARHGGTSLFDDDDEGEEGDDVDGGGGGAGGGGDDADAAERGEPPSRFGGDAAIGGGASPRGRQQQQQQQQQQRRRRQRYGAVLMDFGSARPAAVRIAARADALAVQEDAEAHSTATYRAPELFEPGAHEAIGARADVWSLGCSLFHVMYGASPFQQALDRGASLPLAVIK